MLNLDKVKARLSPKVFDSINTLVDRGDTATLKKWLDAAKEHYKFIGAKSANSDALYYEIEYIKYLLEIKETKMLTQKEKQLVKEYAKKLVDKKIPSKKSLKEAVGAKNNFYLDHDRNSPTLNFQIPYILSGEKIKLPAIGRNTDMKPLSDIALKYNNKMNSLIEKFTMQLSTLGELCAEEITEKIELGNKIGGMEV